MAMQYRWVGVWALLLATAATAQSPVTADAGTRSEVELTLYQGGFALVHDRREVALRPGLNRVHVDDLPRSLRVDSLTLSVPEPVRLRSHRLRPGGLSRERVAHAYIGREVILAPRKGADLSERPATLVDVIDGTPLVRVGDRLEYGGADAPWRLVFPEPPEALRRAPGLTALLDAEDGGPRSLSLTYVAEDLGWQADYRLLLRGDGARLDGQATLRNDSGAGFADARVNLLAGDVSRDRAGGPPEPFLMERGDRAATAAAEDRPEPVGARHVYPLPGTVTLATGEVLRLPLLAASGLPVRRDYRVEGVGAQPRPVQEPQTVPVAVELRVDGGAVDMPLPAGTVRVLEHPEDATPRLLGEDRIDHTPAGEEIVLHLGSAFDLVAERQQTAFQRLSNRRFEMAWTVTVRNRSAETAAVTVAERLPGDWELVESSAEPVSRAAGGLSWRIRVPANGSGAVSYRARIER